MARLARICVYCGSRSGERPSYVAAARALARLLVARGIGLVYGGARVGTMGAIADEVLASGGEVFGVIPRGLVDLEAAHGGLTRLDVVATLHERKARMLELSDGLVTLPGGFGSHDELFEALTWLQLGIHDKPVAVLNVDGYYDGLLAHLASARDEGFLAPEVHDLLIARDDSAELLAAMEEFAPPSRPRWRRAP